MCLSPALDCGLWGWGQHPAQGPSPHRSDSSVHCQVGHRINILWNEGRNEWMDVHQGRDQEQSWMGMERPSILPCLSHTQSLSCSISSPRSGPGTAASCSFSASGRMHCLKRWAWMRPGWDVGRLMGGPGGPWSQGCQNCRTAQLFSMSIWPHILAASSIGTMRGPPWALAPDLAH